MRSSLGGPVDRNENLIDGSVDSAYAHHDQQKVA
jgi:hypothetical protein